MPLNQNHEKLVREVIRESCEIKMAVAQTMSSEIVQAAKLCASSIGNGGKILICGNGGSAADAQHFAAEMVGRFILDREPYGAIALTTDTSILTSTANDFGFDSIFERQVNALGRRGDVLVAISTSGNSPNVLRAIHAAKTSGMKVIAMTGKSGGKIADEADIMLSVPSVYTPRIQESHSIIVHLICEIIEDILRK